MPYLYTLYTMKLTVLPVLVLISSIALMSIGCATSEDPPAEEPEVQEQAVEVQTKEPEREPENIEEPEPQPEVQEEQEPEPEPIAEEPEAEEPSEEEFVVSEEVFTRTFTDIEDLIGRLTRIISAGKYEEWLGYLTKEYKQYYGNQETLKELSQRPILKKYNIRLTSLKDYFEYVVVPSRSDVRLDDLVFEDNNQVKAIMVIEGQRVILYQLEKVDGEWKIGN